MELKLHGGGTLVRLTGTVAQANTYADDKARWINDEEVREHLGRRTETTPKDSMAWMMGMADTLETNYHFAIIDEHGTHIGAVDLRSVNHEDGFGDIGIVIGKEHWSKKYGRRAIWAILKLAFEELKLSKVVLAVWSNNPRGMKCYESVGFSEVARLPKRRCVNPNRSKSADKEFADEVHMEVSETTFLGLRSRTDFHQTLLT